MLWRQATTRFWTKPVTKTDPAQSELHTVAARFFPERWHQVTFNQLKNFGFRP